MLFRSEEDEGGQGEDDSGGDGLAGVSGGLDDVVFEDAGSAEGAEDGDREDRDGDGGGYGEAGAEADVDGDSSEEDAEESAEDKGADGELGARLGGGDEGFEGGGFTLGDGHVDGKCISGALAGGPGLQC